MIKTDEVVFRQSELFGPIWIYRKKNNPEYADEMARETVFYSKDPDVKPGLVEEIRNMALARSQAGSVGDIAAVMKEAILWTTRGRNVTEEDLQAMLEGREDLSEVQENPFAEMMREDDAAEAAMKNESPAPAPTSPESPADSAPTAETSADTSTSAPIDPVTEPATETPTEAEPAAQQMSDEEFEAFMKKAQAFYSGKKTADDSSTEDSADEEIAEESDDDEDEGPTVYGAGDP
jgi:hypothetical protein